MNIQIVLVIVLVVVLVGALGYYVYINNSSLAEKIKAQEDIVGGMINRFENMESIFMRPAVAELESIFEKNPRKCNGNICSLAPFSDRDESELVTKKSSITNEELDTIAEKELAEMSGGSEKEKDA